MEFGDRFEQVQFFIEKLLEDAAPNQYEIYKSLPQFGRMFILERSLMIFADEDVENALRNADIHLAQEIVEFKGLVPPMIAEIFQKLLDKGGLDNEDYRLQALHICDLIKT